jgi:PAS domain S-box-containing protein
MHGTLTVATLFGAVAVAVFFGGVGPGVVATLLGYFACNYLLIAPLHGFTLDSTETLTGFIVYLATCAVIIGVVEAARMSRVPPTGSPPAVLGSEAIRRPGLHSLVVGGFVLTLAVLIVGGIIGYRNVRRLTVNERWVSHTHEVIGQLETLDATLEDAETDPEAMTQVNSAIAQLRASITDNPRQLARLAEIEREAAAGPKGLALVQKLRRRTGEMLDVEKALLRQRAVESNASAKTAILWIALGTGIGLLLICGVFYLTQRNVRIRSEAAETVAKQGELLRVTLASIGDAVITTNLDARVTYLNAIAETLTGWKTGDAAGQPLDTVFRITTEDNDTVLITKDGSHLPIDESIAPIKDDHGRVAGSVVTFHDISERKAAEARIRVLLGELKETDRRKDEFLATLAHELRGPLAPLGNVLAIMKRSEREDGPMRQIRGTIERQVGQLVRLVDDLLDVSRITRGRLELRRDRVELGSILRQAIETCRPLVDERQQQLTVTLPDDPIYLDADRARLAQVFYNLLNNAAKYTPPRGSVSLLAERRGAEVVVRVRDNGLGIDPDKLARIFEPFTQGDSTLENARGGLGIGLSLAKQLVGMHGGSISATSEGTGKGSEFTVRLPIGHPAPPPPRGARPGRQRAGSSGHHVLVVDDNHDSASTLASLLRMSGNEVDLAHDGEEAVVAAEKLRPDVVVLDIGLPKLNGYDACRQIRAQPWGAGMVLVALTGWGQQEDRRQALEAGFDHHMVKPVDYERLAQVLSREA